MAAPPITPLPPAPSRSDDPENFSNKADIFVAAMQAWGEQVSAVGNFAETKANEAEGFRNTAQTHANTATTQAGNSADSAILSQRWATDLTPVAGGLSGARKYAQDAQASAESVINVENTVSTSSTSLSISKGSKVLTVQSGKSYRPGMPVLIASTVNGENLMYGLVTAYSGTSLTVNVTYTQGTGTLAAWSVSGTNILYSSDFLTMSRAARRYIFGG